MDIPDFQSLMLPVLRASSAGEVHIRDVVDRLGAEFALSDAQLAVLLPSGRQTTFANRVHWAKSYLGKAGLIKLTRRGYFEITALGREVLARPPGRLDIGFLKQFPDYPDTKALAEQIELAPVTPLSALTPDEEMRRARDRIEDSLAADILEKIIAAPPAFFERVVVRLVTAMGYGGSLSDAGEALGKSGDGGVDGVINEDILGLDRIYVQAKRYSEAPIGPGAIRDFFGALDQFKANKGLFVTTSTFTSSAKTTAAGLSKRIVLIDGARFARLMVQFDVGCRVEEVIAIKRLDEDFFEA
ncbi:MAG: restriction endonuclease [Sphingomonas sp.]|uniref:restriction endonuclease n=1 Tax=Sphingomonas sp. TaxID=28214 RepID=UPI0017F51D12|nr:restriction endonuclease [Zymomonas sp.]MBA4771990.1 restriction endonuclease [Sphingomonas sp.]